MPNKRKVKYLLFPDHVTSISDSDRHYISYAMLIKCYGVHPSDCLDGSAISFMTKGIDKEFLETLIKLRPRREGDYQEYLEEKIKEAQEEKERLEAMLQDG